MARGGLRGRDALVSFIEQHSIDYVPIAERHGKVWHLWPVWFSGDAHLATVATGIVGIALGGNFAWMVLAVIFGSAFGTFFMAFHSTQGPQLGLPQMIQSRPQFGYLGALLVWVVALIAYIGFNSFNQVLAAQTLHALYRVPRGRRLFGFTLLSLVLAVAGYDLIHVAQRYLAYLLIGALLIFTVAVAAKARLSLVPAPGDFRAVPFLAQFFAAASYQLAWSIYVSDYSRYLPRNVGVSASFWWTYVGAFVGGSWTMLVGTVVAALYPKLEVAAAMLAATDSLLPGFGTPLLLCSLMGLVTITSLNFYGASLTLHERARFVAAEPADARQARAHPHRRRRSPQACWPPHRRRISLPSSARSCRSFCTCSRPGRPSTWWTFTGCARAITRCAKSSIPTVCTAAGTGGGCWPTA